MRVRILSGPRGAGKTTALATAPWIAGAWGFLSPVVEGRRVLRLLPAGTLVPFEVDPGLSTDLGPGRARGDEGQVDRTVGTGSREVRVGRFRFHRDAFHIASQHTLLAPDFPDTRIVVDEVGPLELRGEGFAELLPRLLMRREGELWLVVRTGLVEAVRGRFGLPEDAVVASCVRR